MTETPKYYSLKDGLPTGPEVSMLQKYWDCLKPGDKIPYADIEALLSIKKESPRFLSITRSWRKRMKNQGIIIECEHGKGFFVATADQLTSSTYGVLTSIGRKAKHHRHKLATIKTENQSMMETQHHQMRLLQMLEKETKKSRLNILPSTKPIETPQIKPPESKKESKVS